MSAPQQNVGKLNFEVPELEKYIIILGENVIGKKAIGKFWFLMDMRFMLREVVLTDMKLKSCVASNYNLILYGNNVLIHQYFLFLKKFPLIFNLERRFF